MKAWLRWRFKIEIGVKRGRQQKKAKELAEEDR